MGSWGRARFRWLLSIASQGLRSPLVALQAYFAAQPLTPLEESHLQQQQPTRGGCDCGGRRKERCSIGSGTTVAWRSRSVLEPAIVDAVMEDTEEELKSISSACHSPETGAAGTGGGGMMGREVPVRHTRAPSFKAAWQAQNLLDLLNFSAVCAVRLMSDNKPRIPT
jgi:hypothetical protein